MSKPAKDQDVVCIGSTNPSTAEFQCCVCGKPITDNVSFATASLSHRWHVQCKLPPCSADETKLEHYRKLHQAASEYYAANQTEIDADIAAIASKKILDTLPSLLSTGTVDVWCRNADVCREATHCRSLDCGYKSSKDDVVPGCAKCRDFQLTSVSELFERARHVADHGSVEVYKLQNGIGC